MYRFVCNAHNAMDAFSSLFAQCKNVQSQTRAYALLHHNAFHLEQVLRLSLTFSSQITRRRQHRTLWIHYVLLVTARSPRRADCRKAAAGQHREDKSAIET